MANTAAGVLIRELAARKDDITAILYPLESNLELILQQLLPQSRTGMKEEVLYLGLLPVLCLHVILLENLRMLSYI